MNGTAAKGGLTVASQPTLAEGNPFSLTEAEPGG
jgi:hypothetical protein